MRGVNERSFCFEGEGFGVLGEKVDGFVERASAAGKEHDVGIQAGEISDDGLRGFDGFEGGGELMKIGGGAGEFGVERDGDGKNCFGEGAVENFAGGQDGDDALFLHLNLLMGCRSSGAASNAEKDFTAIHPVEDEPESDDDCGAADE